MPRYYDELIDYLDEEHRAQLLGPYARSLLQPSGHREDSEATWEIYPPAASRGAELPPVDTSWVTVEDIGTGKRRYLDGRRVESKAVSRKKRDYLPFTLGVLFGSIAGLLTQTILVSNGVAVPGGLSLFTLCCGLVAAAFVVYQLLRG